MKTVRIAAVLVLGFGILVLWLNTGEKDYYDGGSLAPPKDAGVPEDDGLYHRLLPRDVAHPCKTCGDCTHPVRTVSNERVMSVIDRDGWYKLFWAGSERYYYDDPIALAAAFLNRTAGSVLGRWSIRVRLEPATHGNAGVHDCGELPQEIALDYELVSSADRIPERFASGAPVPILESMEFLSYGYDRPHLPPALHFGWRLASPPVAVPVRCPCGTRP